MSYLYSVTLCLVYLYSSMFPFVVLELEDKAQTEGDNSPKVWIAYSRGNKVLKGNGPEDLGSRLIFGGPVVYPTEPIRSKFLSSNYGRSPYSDDFHIYTLDWRPGRCCKIVFQVLCLRILGILGGMVLYIDNEVFGDRSTRNVFQEYSMDVRNAWTDPEAPYNREVRSKNNY